MKTPGYAVKTVALAVLLLLVGVATAEASLKRARELAGAGRLVEARRMLEELTLPDVGAGKRAEALALLGGVAVRQGELETARAAWTELADRYPDSAFAWEAETGLALLRQLGGQGPSAPPQAETGMAPTAPPHGGGALPPAATARLMVPREQMSNAVLVAGDGEPPEVIEEVVLRVVERLRASGVDAEMIPVEVWWRRPYKLAEPALYRTVREAGAASLVWVEMRFGFREKFGVACYTPDGRRQFEERGSGGSAFAGDHRPHDEYNEELVERVLDDIDGRVGDPCLPTG